MVVALTEGGTRDEGGDESGRGWIVDSDQVRSDTFLVSSLKLPSLSRPNV